MDFTDIVYKVFRDEPLSDTELDALIAWFVSEDGRERFDREIARKMDEFSEGGDVAVIDYETLLEKLHDRIGTSAQPVRRRLGGVYRRITAAAAVVLIAAAGYLFSERAGGRADGFDHVRPGGQIAVLQLGDGTSITLDGSAGGRIERAGTHATVGDGELRYQDVATLKDVKFNRLYVPRGGEYRVVLGDGTAVWLNSDSRLEYPLSFPGDERRVTLEGEAYFEVAHDPSKPFIVETPAQALTVLGTGFNLSAYREDNRTVTTLVHGSVRVVNKSNNEKTQLAPGEQSQLDNDSGLFTVITVDTADAVAWKEGLFVFDEQSLEQVMLKLARWYDIEVAFDHPDAKEIVFKGNLPKYQEFATLLGMIEKISAVTFRMKGQVLHVGMER